MTIDVASDDVIGVKECLAAHLAEFGDLRVVDVWLLEENQMRLYEPPS